MIITTGKIIKIEVGEFLVQRSAETPGIATLTHRKTGHAVDIHASEIDAVCRAVKYALDSDIPYRTTEVK